MFKVMQTLRGLPGMLNPKLSSLLVIAAALSSCAIKKSANVPDVSRNPAAVQQWSDQLLSTDRAVNRAAATTLVEQGSQSLPLLQRLLQSSDENLRQKSFDIVRRIGPPAIPLLAQMLRDPRVSSRRIAADMLIDLAPDTASIQPALHAALKDRDPLVAGDAARALGALHERAAESVPALIQTLSHPDTDTRVFAAEALASIGPNAAPAADALTQMLHDQASGARWAACEGLASIGPAATPAIPQLIQALSDPVFYVRICAAGALGNLGPEAKSAQEALKTAAKDPALRAEANWALARITGEEISDDNSPQTPPIQPATINPRLAPPAGNPPLDWNTDTGKNIAWSADLGNETFGRPVVTSDVVYVGTDNAQHRNPAFKEECGTLAAFNAKDGTFLWQDLAPRVKRGLREFLLPSTTSAPYVEGDRLYYLTAECQLRCLKTRVATKGAADIIWELDLCATLGVFPHEACSSDVISVGDLLILCTSNGQNAGHTRVPSPRAPSLIAVNKHTGQVAWRAIGPGANVLHGQWSSPVAANINGRAQVLFGGGDGWLRAYDAASGRELWRFDGNPKDALWRPRPRVFSRSSIIASPVYADGRVFIAMGEDPSHGDGPSLLHAISPGGQQDVTQTRRLWTNNKIGRVVATPVVKDGLLYVADIGGKVYCIDTTTGETIWTHDTQGEIWGCLALAGGKIYVGNLAGQMTVLEATRKKKVLAEFETDAPLYSRPAITGNTMYLATARKLYRIEQQKPN